MKRMLSILLALCLFACTALAATGANPLIANLSGPAAPEYQTVAEVAAPEGYALLEGISPNFAGAEPEYYFAPEDAQSPVRFLYYTTGYGNSYTLAKNAVERYHTFYEVFEAGSIVTNTLADKECLSVVYTCSYAGQDGVTPVYEQSALCYFPVQDGVFIACIASLEFDSAEEYLGAEEMNAILEQAAAAIEMRVGEAVEG